MTLVGALMVFFIAGLSLGLLDYYHAVVSTLGFTRYRIEGDEGQLDGLGSVVVRRDRLEVVVSPAHPWATQGPDRPAPAQRVREALRRSGR